MKDVYKSSSAILFLGTPHRGSGRASLGEEMIHSTNLTTSSKAGAFTAGVSGRAAARRFLRRHHHLGRRGFRGRRGRGRRRRRRRRRRRWRACRVPRRRRHPDDYWCLCTPPLPPPLYKRRKKDKADHATSTPITGRRARQRGSDFEPPSPTSLAADDENPYIFASPDDVLPVLHRRRLQHYPTPLDKASNPGQALFHFRRDAWTGASPVTGLIPVCTSRFADSPLTRLAVLEAYLQVYKKVVVNGAVPPVPIALVKMVTAIVEGWKRSDVWGRKLPSLAPSMCARTRGSTREEREKQREWVKKKYRECCEGTFVDDLVGSQTFYVSAKKKNEKL